MDGEAMKQLVRRYYDELWTRGRMAFAGEHMTQAYENHDPATPGRVVSGRDGLRALVASYREAFPDLRFDIVEQFVDGNVVISRWHASGTQRGALLGIAPTGKRAAAIEGVTLTSFERGQIARDRVVWDTLGLLRQLGAVPA